MTSLIQAAKKFKEGFRSFETILNRIASIILLILMFLAAGDVLGRYIFNTPIFGAMEIEKILLGAIVFLGWAYTQSQDGHISVNILYIHYHSHVQAIIRFITLLLSLFLFIIIGWRTIIVCIMEWRLKELIQIILIPSAPFKILVVFGAILICVEFIIQLLHLFPEIVSRKGR